MTVYIREMPKDEIIDSSGRLSRAWEMWFNDLRLDVLPKVSEAVSGNLAVVESDGRIRDGGVPPSVFAGAVHDHTETSQGGVIPAASWTQAEAQSAAVDITRPTASVTYSHIWFSGQFGILTDQLNALVAVVNGLIAKLKAAGVMADE